MLDKDTLLNMFYQMVKIRRVEERVLDIFAQGKIPGFIHVSIGQEAIPVGVCSCLRQDDFISNTHRGHGQALAKVEDTLCGPFHFSPNGYAISNRYLAEVKLIDGKYDYGVIKTYTNIRDPRDK